MCCVISRSDSFLPRATTAKILKQNTTPQQHNTRTQKKDRANTGGAGGAGASPPTPLLPWAEEVLVARSELDERRARVAELEQQVCESFVVVRGCFFWGGGLVERVLMAGVRAP
jgi:hypothetical protein